MIDHEMIRGRIKRLTSYIEELRPFAHMPYKEYMGSYLYIRTAERILQLMVDTAVEINDHLLVESGLPAPEDYNASFINLVRIKLLAPDAAKSIAQSTGLRNLLVHEYAVVDAQRVFEAIPQAIREYTGYCKSVLKFLAKKK